MSDTPAGEDGFRLRVANVEGKVILNFGEPVAWIALNPQDAADFATFLIKHARAAAHEAGIPITVQL